MYRCRMSDRDTPEAREAAWNKEWNHQLSLLPQEKQDGIRENPMHPAADHLDEAVEKILCERGEL